MPYLFVYGTLMRGGCRHRVLANQRFVGEAVTVSDYKLLDLDEYPGLIEILQTEQVGVAVHGELYEIAEPQWLSLDQVEGVDIGLYSRAPVRLQPPYADWPTFGYLFLGDSTVAPDAGTRWQQRSHAKWDTGAPHRSGPRDTKG